MKIHPMRGLLAMTLLAAGPLALAQDAAWGVYARLAGASWATDGELVSSYTWKEPGRELVRTSVHPRALVTYETEVLKLTAAGRIESATWRHDGTHVRTELRLGSDGSVSRDAGDFVESLASDAAGGVVLSTCVGSTRTACVRAPVRAAAAEDVERIATVRRQWGFMADLAGRAFRGPTVLRFAWAEPGRVMREMFSLDGRRLEYESTLHADGRLERIEKADGSKWEGKPRPDGGMDWVGGPMQANIKWVPGEHPVALNQEWLSRLIAYKPIGWSEFVAAVQGHKNGPAPTLEESAPSALDGRLAQARSALLRTALQSAAASAPATAPQAAAPTAVAVAVAVAPPVAQQPVPSAAAPQPALAPNGRRRALVIGNDQYQHVPQLQNARGDARAIAQGLGRLGFNVTLRTDLDERAFKQVLRKFRSEVQGGDEVVVYFAGHGVQLGGANYLLPVDIRGEGEDQVRDEALPLQRVLDDFLDGRAAFLLAIVDACRDNPFKGNGRAIGGRGLAPPVAASGQMVLFSAGSGQQALDRLGPQDRSSNGLFTRVFLQEMDKPGVAVDRLLRNVRSEVVRLAKTVGHDQTPALYDQAVGDFYLRPR